MQNTYIGIGAIIVLVTVYNTQVPFIKQIQESAVWFMLGFLGIALISVYFDSKRIMLSSFAFTAILCLFLKSSSNNTLKLPEENNEVKLSVAHINVSSVEGNYESFTNELLNSDLDIISLQEVKPDWAMFLRSELSESFPYYAENIRIDPFGMAIYSKFPIVSKDTLFYDDIPFLKVELQPEENKNITVLNTLLLPSIDSRLDEIQEQQLKFAGEFMSKNEGTELVLGDFNMVYWSGRIRDFRNITGLQNSRRDVSSSVLSIPYDHIFHSEDLECTMFRDLIDSSGTRLGISANFQFLNNAKAEL